MIDSGLLISIAACVLAVLAVDRLHPAGMRRSSWFDLAFLPGLSGLVAGRLVTIAIEDPAGFVRLRGLLILRGGAELWPGVAVGLTVLAVRAYRGGPSFWPTAQRLAPLGAAAWGAYEAACPARGACPGPRSPFGLTPTGMLHRQLPVGLLVGIVGVGCAAGLAARARRSTAMTTVIGSVVIVSGLRSLASFWLPHLGTGITRQHAASLVVLVGSGTLLLLHGARWGRPRRSAPPGDEGSVSAAGEVISFEEPPVERGRPPG